VPADPDLRQYQREMALEAVAQRNGSHKGDAVVPRPINRKTKSSSLIELYKNDSYNSAHVMTAEDDEDLVAFALQESFDHSKFGSDSHAASSSSSAALVSASRETSPDNMYGEFATPSRLKTVISIANTTPNRSHPTPTNMMIQPSVFGESFLSSSATGPPIEEKGTVERSETSSSIHSLDAQVQRMDGMQYVDHPDLNPNLQHEETIQRLDIQPRLPQQVEIMSSTTKLAEKLLPTPTSNSTSLWDKSTEHLPSLSVKEVNQVDDEPDMKTSPFFVLSGNLLQTSGNNLPMSDSDEENMEEVLVESQAMNPLRAESTQVADFPPVSLSDPQLYSPPLTLKSVHEEHPDSDHDEEPPFAWSRTPSPMRDLEPSAPIRGVEESWDAAEEMDIHAEEGEFARFMSQVKGRNVDDIRKEIDDEIKSLNQQRKNAMRDSEDITQQMVSQIMVSLSKFLDKTEC